MWGEDSVWPEAMDDLKTFIMTCGASSPKRSENWHFENSDRDLFGRVSGTTGVGRTSAELI